MSKEITVKEAVAQLDKRIKLLEELDKAFEKQIADQEKKPKISEFKGLLKAYTAIVKKAGINMAPSCVSAIQKAEQQPSDATLTNARKALEEHGKKAKDTPKTGPAFASDIASLMKELDLAIKDAK